MHIRVEPASANHGMTPALAAEHDLGDTIPAEGLHADRPVLLDQPIPPRTWVWSGEVMGS
jgi:hypothetical protein